MAILAVVSILLMIGITFVIYLSLGSRPESLVISREKKEQWDRLINGELGVWFTKCNIFATLTSLATVYIFFIGNFTLLGAWVFAAPITLIIGVFTTNWLTRKICESKSYCFAMERQNQANSVLCSIFWNEDVGSKHLAKSSRIFLITYLLAILWLEFSVFSRITGQIISPGDIWVQLLVFFVACFSTTLFTLKYGLRGFVFADLFQSPIIVIGTVVILFGVVGNFYSEILTLEVSIENLLGEALFSPKVDFINGVIFVLAVLFLNSFLVVSTPAHWTRVWIFGKERVINHQLKSTSFTTLIWIVLIFIGLGLSLMFLSKEVESTPLGELAVIELLIILADNSSIYVFAFWLTGMAALFSTVDSQLYSLALIRNYDPEENSLSKNLHIKKPSLVSFLFSTVLCMAYFLFFYYDTHLDKVALLVLPSCLVLVPAMALKARGKRISPNLIIITLCFYIAVASISFIFDEHSYFLILGAPLVPLIVTVWTTLKSSRKERRPTKVTEFTQ